jgi:hypothetical protein
MFAEEMQLDTLYWPVAQTEQLVQFETAVIPDPVEYVPVWQVVHDVGELAAISDRYVPGWQAVQLMMLETPRPVEYVPDPHETHLLDMVTPVPVLYLPAGQASQFTPDQLAGGWSWTPAGKFCHVLFQPASPVNPALQVQAV